MLRGEGIEIPESVREWLRLKESEGMTSLLIRLDHRPLGMISIADTLREKAKTTIEKIRREGVSEIWMLTGDSEQVADRIGKELGISGTRRVSFRRRRL